MQSVKLKNNKYWDATGLYDSTLNKTQREVNAAQASATAAKYTKPAGGIPKTDLASGVQASLDKADTALQQHQSLAAYRTAAAQDAIDVAQDTAIAGKYTKPGTGIPASDLAAAVQSSLGRADSAVEYTAQTLTDAQQTQARSNIGAADVEIYQAERVNIALDGTNSSTRSIVVTGTNANTTGEQSVHIGAGYLTENCAFMIGTRGRMTNDDYIVHPEYADYAEDGYLESKLNSRGSLVIGTCQVNTPYTAYPAFAFGSKSIAGNGMAIAIGQCCLATGILAVAIGDGLTAKYSRQHVVCKHNNCLAEDLFEVGNGASGARSNAFRVTSTGHAIAQNALGIEDGNGGVVEISAAELQALKNLLT